MTEMSWAAKEWTNYDERRVGGVTFGLPACLLYFPTVLRRICSNFVKNTEISGNALSSGNRDSPQFWQNLVKFSAKNIRFGAKFSESAKNQKICLRSAE